MSLADSLGMVGAEPFIRIQSEPWMANGLCRRYSPELFYPDVGESDKIARAKQICRDCPVTMQCLEYALKHEDDWGVWGGATWQERRRMRRRRKGQQ